MKENTLDILWPEIPSIRTDGSVLKHWLKQDGAWMDAGEIVALVETPDALVEIVAERAGRLRHTVGAGEALCIGKVLGQIVFTD